MKIKHYWDKKNNIYTAKILPGEYYVTSKDEAIVTVLGSCISACIRDKVAKVGGMNHFMLPAEKNNNTPGWSEDSNATRYGNYAMEHMLNEIYKLGGKKERLEVKVFGGGRMLSSTTSVGWSNIGFVFDYIFTEGMTIVSQDVGNIFPRKVIYFPATGKVKVKRLKSLTERTLVETETNYKKSIDIKPKEGEIELF